MWAFKREIPIFREFSAFKTVKIRLSRRTYKQMKFQTKDEEKLRLVSESLRFNDFGIECGELEQLRKCLYPVRNGVVNFPDGKEFQVGNLQRLGRTLLRLSIMGSFMNVFKRSRHDINGLDFNYEEKMTHMSTSRRSPEILLRRFITHRFDRLARVPMPEKKVPLRIHRVFDQRCLFAIIGYVSVINDHNKITALLRERVAKPILKKAFGM
ncbi:LAFA_0G12024g1_1 [Lachancea sp. 'fantastica']|nr:LAFA_0G12024g1_1 [Lachancea sp. 'fantastica']